METTKFSYVQIGAKDYKALADFYVNAIGFTVSDDQSWLRGQEGICLVAPGFSSDAPIFGFVPATEGSSANINDAGFAHTCFETTDVKGAVKRLMQYGGSVHSTMKKPEIHPCVYCKDPEGNVVEFHIPFPSESSIGAYLNTATSLLGLKPNGAIKFIHVNIICPDWKKLCNFYNNVFQCTTFGKMKDHQGGYKEQVIGVPGVHVVGQHVLLPGFEKDYPTLEIFTYSIPGRAYPCDEHGLGINCIGFTCDNMQQTLNHIRSAGGFLNEQQDEYILAGDIQNGRILLRQK